MARDGCVRFACSEGGWSFELLWCSVFLGMYATTRQRTLQTQCSTTFPPARPTTLNHHDYDKPTCNARPNNNDDDDEQEDDDKLLILSQSISS